MTISSVSGTPSQAVSGLAALRYTHHKGASGGSKTLLPVATGSSSDNANQLASAVAAAMAQLGLTITPTTLSTAALTATPANGLDDGAAKNDALPAALPQQQKAQQQVQQYRNVASTFSNLAQALDSNSNTALYASSGSSNLTTVFQNLWSSLGASSGTLADASGSAIPSLPSFLQTLAQNFGESGISGLRGVFVDTVV
jgi:ABC-type transporter Mla subunit MlaD